MSPILASRIVLSLIGLLCLVKLATCRTQSSIDSQFQFQQNLPEIRRLYNNYNNNLQMNSLTDEQIAFNRLQLQLLASYMQKSMPQGWADPLYRNPEMKRQVRYRQCYFNPISCFRK